MIAITTDRTKAIYVRSNRRVRWQYADYCGRWESADRALNEAKGQYAGQHFEYRIEDICTGEVVTGFVK